MRLGRLLALLANMRLSRKNSSRKNTLAYLYVIIGDDEKVFIALAPASLVQTGNKSEKEKNYIFNFFFVKISIKKTQL